MDEQHPAAPEGPRTGVDTVDAVTASIEALHDRPVAEHAAVFEAAHDALRRALDSDPDAGATTPPED
jgi:hypothetical protein